MNTVGHARGFDATCGVHGITEKLETGVLSSKHASCDRSTMETHPEGKLGGTRAKFGLQFLGNIFNRGETGTGESCHGDRVVVSGDGDSTNSNVTISYSLDFEDAASLGNLVESTENGFQKNKDLEGFFRTLERGRTYTPSELY
jgi:hypothetical protein